MIKPGEVLALDNGYALVKMQRGAGCGKDKCPLSVPLLDDYGKASFQVRAKNLLDAAPGDTVLVEIEDRTAMIIAFSLYLMPLLLVSSAYFSIRLVTGNTAIISIAVIASLVVAAFALKWLDRNIQPRYTVIDFVDQESICSSCPLSAKNPESEVKTP
ncbi:MAG TPA: SoxR reducing system RseC family protein [Atribacteraceae bacterium]|nr:SoxR reducing system RseC family protein [Atribacteraceae bacterium]